MQVGLIGLGRMGSGIARRLCRANIHVVGHDTGAPAIEALVAEPGLLSTAPWGLLLLLSSSEEKGTICPASRAAARSDSLNLGLLVLAAAVF